MIDLLNFKLIFKSINSVNREEGDKPTSRKHAHAKSWLEYGADNLDQFYAVMFSGAMPENPFTDLEDDIWLDFVLW